PGASVILQSAERERFRPVLQAGAVLPASLSGIGFAPGLFVVSGPTRRPVNGQAVPLAVTGRLSRPALLLRVPRDEPNKERKMTDTSFTSIQPVTADTVIHGDCIDIMRGMETGSVDMILTDPP